MPGRIGRVNSAMLIAAIACVFAGCASKDHMSPVDAERQAFEDLRNEIREVIDDPVREADAIELVDALVTDLEALRGRVADRKQRIRELNANYDTPRAEFDAFLLQANRVIQENRRQVGVSHRAFIALVTPDEFSVIQKVHSKAMNATIESMQAI